MCLCLFLLLTVSSRLCPPPEVPLFQGNSRSVYDTSSASISTCLLTSYFSHEKAPVPYRSFPDTLNPREERIFPRPGVHCHGRWSPSIQTVLTRSSTRQRLTTFRGEGASLNRGIRYNCGENRLRGIIHFLTRLRCAQHRDAFIWRLERRTRNSARPLGRFVLYLFIASINVSIRTVLPAY